jgi:TAT (twin-arginine translocation) pathway signal sequence
MLARGDDPPKPPRNGGTARPPVPPWPMSRRQVLAGAGGTGLLAATASPAKAAIRARRGQRRHP